MKELAKDFKMSRSAICRLLARFKKPPKTAKRQGPTKKAEKALKVIKKAIATKNKWGVLSVQDMHAKLWKAGIDYSRTQSSRLMHVNHASKARGVAPKLTVAHR